jgi:hypothetical protein
MVQNTCPKTCRSATIEICRLIHNRILHNSVACIIILLPVNAKPEDCKCDGDECMRQRALMGITNNDVYISLGSALMQRNETFSYNKLVYIRRNLPESNARNWWRVQCLFIRAYALYNC